MTTPPRGGVVRLVLVSFWGPKIRTHFFKKCPQHQSRSSEMCFDTSLTSPGTSSTTLFMIMIGFGQYFAFFVKNRSRFGLGQDHPPPRGGGHRDRLTVTNLRDVTVGRSQGGRGVTCRGRSSKNFLSKMMWRTRW